MTAVLIEVLKSLVGSYVAGKLLPDVVDVDPGGVDQGKEVVLDIVLHHPNRVDHFHAGRELELLLRHRHKLHVAKIVVNLRLEVSAQHFCVDDSTLDVLIHLCFAARKVGIFGDFKTKESAIFAA